MEGSGSRSGCIEIIADPDTGTLLDTIKFLDLNRSLNILATGRVSSFLISLVLVSNSQLGFGKNQEVRF